ncbi:MAG: adenylylsulfate kinase [Flavobacteriales bacterium]|jgi:adenylylsulfate kinase
MKKENNIHPTFDQLLTRNQKEALLKQKSKVIWLTGLSGSGKTTVANAFERKLFQEGFFTNILDGDNIRTGINNNLGFSEEDRIENIRRIAEVAKLFMDSGVITICCFVSPTKEIREQAKSIVGTNDFIEVFVNTPIAICEQRDVKGLYAKARKGEIKNFTGIDAPFEAPTENFIDLKTENQTIAQTADNLYRNIIAHLK